MIPNNFIKDKKEMQNIFPTALLQKEHTKMQRKWNFGLTSNKKEVNVSPGTECSHV